MPPVFAHGRLRLYLLGLLDEAPRHGYEVIRLLEERFQGLYAPSAGTVYPRLSKLEAEGLVTHATEGGRKVYSITDAGRAELAGRSGELADLELEIRDSVSELAAEIRDDVRVAAGQLRVGMRAAASQTRKSSASSAGRLGGLAGTAWPPYTEPDPANADTDTDTSTDADTAAGWAKDIPGTNDPARDLDRLLDRFRDDIRDAARDHGVTKSQLGEARRHLSTAAAHIGALMRTPPTA